jgi:hypothetical protein
MDPGDRKQALIKHAKRVEQLALRVREPEVRETMHSVAALYLKLAKQTEELTEHRRKARLFW